MTDLDEFWSQVDGTKPVSQVWVAVQGLRPLCLWHFLLALQLFTDVFHQLHLQGAIENTVQMGGVRGETHSELGATAKRAGLQCGGYLSHPSIGSKMTLVG